MIWAMPEAPPRFQFRREQDTWIQRAAWMAWLLGILGVQREQLYGRHGLCESRLSAFNVAIRAINVAGKRMP
ncbi:MAG: hypothetical protein WCQ77_16520, partial [Planctomycetota bacterium]